VPAPHAGPTPPRAWRARAPRWPDSTKSPGALASSQQRVAGRAPRWPHSNKSCGAVPHAGQPAVSRTGPLHRELRRRPGAIWRIALVVGEGGQPCPTPVHSNKSYGAVPHVPSPLLQEAGQGRRPDAIWRIALVTGEGGLTCPTAPCAAPAVIAPPTRFAEAGSFWPAALRVREARPCPVFSRRG
jgi:hypothetical protein